MKRHLNLLPAKLQSRLLFRLRTRQWVLGGVLSAVLTLAVVGHAWQERSSARQELEIWKRRAATIEAIHEANQRLSQKISVLDARLNKYQNWQTDRVGYLLLATVSRSARLSGGEIQVQKFSFQPLATSPAAPVGETQDTPQRESYLLSLHGVAKTNLQLAHFVSALRDSGAFLRVDLKSSHGKNQEFAGLRTYQVDCAF